MRIPLPLTGPDQASRSKEQNPQKTVNLYVRPKKRGGKDEMALYSCPGLSFHAQAGSSGGRSNFVEFKGRTYVAFGDALYALDGTGSSVKVGTLSTTGGRVEMVIGRDYLMIVDGTAGYTYDGTTFATIADADFPNGATHCDYLDGFFIANEPGTGRFWVSVSEDPTSWSALDFATGEADPDATLALAANFKSLYLIGGRSTEVWYNSGDQIFPFAPYPGGVLEVGIQAPHSLVRTSQGLFFLATSREGDVFIVQMDGLQQRTISEPISWDLTQMTTTSDAIGSAYRWDGRTIYRITFPTEDKSFEFFVEDGAWLERKSKGIGRHRASGIGYFANNYYFADHLNGRVYTLDENVYTEDGDYIERIRETQTIHQDDRRIAHNALYIDIESGVGLVSGQGEDPKIMLSWSDDGGKTYSNEVWAGMGKIGAYSYRASWRRLGMARHRTYRIRITDPVNVTILGGYADIQVMNS